MMRSSFSADTFLLATILAAALGCAVGSGVPIPGATPHDTEARTDGVATDDCAILCRRACHSSSGTCFRNCFSSCWGGDPPPHTATLLQNGQVLIAGGTTDPSLGAYNTAELYDPVTGTFAAVSSTLRNARYAHTATLLKDGRVFLIGGRLPNGNETNTTEFFDGSSFSAGPNMLSGRAGHSAVLLP